MSGLILVSLPIGNKFDITQRAIDTINTANIILAEDTRVFKELCKKVGIEYSNKRIDSFHDHSGDKKSDRVLTWIKEEKVVLVSDAGSPLISDPAYPLVQEVLTLGLSLETVPGVSAPTVALELSGLPPIPFHFHGFGPREKGKRRNFFEELGSIYGTHSFFEGVSRVESSVSQLVEAFPKSQICIARELTKTFESVYRFAASDWEEVRKEIVFKGEFVILFYNDDKSGGAGASKNVSALCDDILENGAHPKKISKLLAELTGKSPKEIYQSLLQKK